MQMILARRRSKAGKITGAELGKRIGLQEGTNRSSRSMGYAMKPWLLYNGNRKDRSGERRWGERNGNRRGHQQAVMAASAVCRVSPGDRATGCRAPPRPTSAPDRLSRGSTTARCRLASCFICKHPVPTWNGLPRSTPPERRGWFTPRRHLSTRVVTGGRCRPGSRPPPRASLAGRACGRTPWGQGPGPGPAWVQKLR
jgi:hypothetical protein